jgi:hypothetical protein
MHSRCRSIQTGTLRHFAGEGARPTWALQRKRPHSFLNVAFIYAGDDLRSRLCGAGALAREKTGTIGPAGLNLRRFAGVSESPQETSREPAAEILSGAQWSQRIGPHLLADSRNRDFGASAVFLSRMRADVFVSH